MPITLTTSTAALAIAIKEAVHVCVVGLVCVGAGGCAYSLCAYDISWYGAMVGIVVECGE